MKTALARIVSVLLIAIFASATIFHTGLAMRSSTFTPPSLCPNVGDVPIGTYPYLFSDDMEGGNGNWTFVPESPDTTAWGITEPDPANYHSPTHSLFGPDLANKYDSYAEMNADINLPTGTDVASFLYFYHWFSFEPASTLAYDAGVVEYSIDHGVKWQDARPLFSIGQDYNYQIANTGSSLQDRWAFSGNSDGMVASRYDLSRLSGQSVRFRWRIGTDGTFGGTGWSVDDISIYTCNPPITKVYIGGDLMESYGVESKNTIKANYPSFIGGPVKVISPEGSKIFTSQRAFYGISMNELMGYPTNQFTTEYWFPWYDQVYMNSWILVGNPSSSETAYVDIYVGGHQQETTYEIPPNGRITPQYLGLIGGPVQVISTTGPKTSTPLKIFSSERATYSISFNELMGYPSNQLTTEYWFPWYDQVYMNSWILVGNPSSSETAYVDIYVGGHQQETTYEIPPNGRITPQYLGLIGGPVQVISTTGPKTSTPLKIFSSERVTYGSSFNEVMGYPSNQFTTEYWFPWYDNVSMRTWILVGNPSGSETAYVDIYVGGHQQETTYEIPPNGRITPEYISLNAGPVRVVSTTGPKTSTPVDIFTSERVTYGPSFNEVMGYPDNQLTTEYWYTWYDGVYMSTDLMISKP